MHSFVKALEREIAEFLNIKSEVLSHQKFDTATNFAEVLCFQINPPKTGKVN